MGARLKAGANRAKSGSVNFSRRLSRRTTIKKHRWERKGRRSFDSAIKYGTVAIIATEKTRTAKSAVRATCFRIRVKMTLAKVLIPLPAGARRYVKPAPGGRTNSHGSD